VTSALSGVFAKQITTDTAKTCTDLTDGQSILSRKIEIVNAKEVGETTIPKHLKLTEKSTVVCASDSAKKMAVTFEIKCNEAKEWSGSTAADTKIIKVDESDKCNPVIVLSAPAGCPRMEANTYIKYISENPIVLAIVIIALGGVMTFVGKKFFDWCLMVVGFVFGFTMIMMFCSMVGMLNALNHDSKGGVGLLVTSFFLALAGGAGMAFLAKISKQYGIMALGAFGGYMLGTIIYTGIITIWWTNSIGAVLTGIICAIIAAGLSIKLQDKVMVILTAFIGAYLFVRGFSMFIGGYPNEALLYQQMNNDVPL